MVLVLLMSLVIWMARIHPAVVLLTSMVVENVYLHPIASVGVVDFSHCMHHVGGP